VRPAFNLEPKYSVTILTREEWTRRPGTHAVKELVWFTGGSMTKVRTGAVVYEQSFGRRLSISVGKYTIDF
jgi:hypothetical protein